MTDNLRDRIAAVIEAQQVSEYQGSIHPEDVMRLADAVIKELVDNLVHPYCIRCGRPHLPAGGCADQLRGSEQP